MSHTMTQCKKKSNCARIPVNSIKQESRLIQSHRMTSSKPTDPRIPALAASSQDFLLPCAAVLPALRWNTRRYVL